MESNKQMTLKVGEGREKWCHVSFMLVVSNIESDLEVIVVG